MENLFQYVIHRHSKHNDVPFNINDKSFLNIIFYISLISTMTDVPIIKPINITEYEFKQPKYEHVLKLPFRSIIVASSTGGKTVLVQNLILNVYRNSFAARIFIFSPSVHNDPTFTEVKKYIRDELHVDDEQ